MALVIKDRVRQTSTTAGTGTITLSGFVSGYQDFSVIGSGNTTYYTIADQSGSNWEVGLGTYTSPNQLVRTTVYESSNSNNLVNFGSNVKDVFVTFPAEAVGSLGITGSGTTNYVSKFTSTSAIDNSIIYDNGTNVGIGTSSPASKLDVNGGVLAKAFNATNTPVVFESAGGAVLAYNGSGDGVLRAYSDAAGAGGQLLFYSGGSERMRIDASGNVGIGTSSPSYKLHVYGTSVVPAVIQSNQTQSFLTYKDTNTTDNPGVGSSGNNMVFYTTSAERMRIDSSGNVGINTTATVSGCRLNVEGGINSSNGGLNVSGNGGFYNAANKFGVDNNAGVSRIYSSGSNSSTRGSYDFRITDSVGTLDTSAMVIGSSGNVGIGTSSPAAKLDVSGTVKLGTAGADTITLTGQVSANASVGTAGQVLTSRGANLSPQWTTVSGGGSGTVTSVNGTGTVSGISLSGTVTNSGSLTLGGSLDLSAPPAIGGTTPNTITGTTVTANTAINLPAIVNLGTTGVLEMVDGGDGYDYLNLYTTDGFSQFGVICPAGITTTGITASFQIYSPTFVGTTLTLLTTAAQVSLIGSASTGSGYTITLPPTAGSANQVLKTDGTGVTSWTDKFILGAGTATVAPLQLTSGTNLTTAAAGAIEYNGTAAFITGTAASGRGINLAPQMVRVNTDRAKTTNNTTLEPVFDAANDVLALAANTLYYFKGVYVVTKSATGTAGGVQVGFAFSNAQQEIGYKSIGFTAASGTAQTTIYNTVVTAVTATATATGATDYVVEIEGWFKSNATTGGTLTPQFTQSVVGTTVAPTMKANSWFMVQPMSSNPSATLIAGNWS